jgi:hypothetical protein
MSSKQHFSFGFVAGDDAREFLHNAGVPNLLFTADGYRTSDVFAAPLPTLTPAQDTNVSVQQFFGIPDSVDDADADAKAMDDPMELEENATTPHEEEEVREEEVAVADAEYRALVEQEEEADPFRERPPSDDEDEDADEAMTLEATTPLALADAADATLVNTRLPVDVRQLLERVKERHMPPAAAAMPNPIAFDMARWMQGVHHTADERATLGRDTDIYGTATRVHGTRFLYQKLGRSRPRETREDRDALHAIVQQNETRAVDAALFD